MYAWRLNNSLPKRDSYKRDSGTHSHSGAMLPAVT